MSNGVQQKNKEEASADSVRISRMIIRHILSVRCKP